MQQWGRDHPISAYRYPVPTSRNGAIDTGLVGHGGSRSAAGLWDREGKVAVAVAFSAKVGTQSPKAGKPQKIASRGNSFPELVTNVRDGSGRLVAAHEREK